MKMNKVIGTGDFRSSIVFNSVPSGPVSLLNGVDKIFYVLPLIKDRRVVGCN